MTTNGRRVHKYGGRHDELLQLLIILEPSGTLARRMGRADIPQVDWIDPRRCTLLSFQRPLRLRDGTRLSQTPGPRMGPQRATEYSASGRSCLVRVLKFCEPALADLQNPLGQGLYGNVERLRRKLLAAEFYTTLRN